MNPTSAPTVVIYSTPTCHFCHMAKDMFTQHGIAFTDYDVASNLEKRQEMVTKTGQMGVPVIAVTPAGATNEEIIIGFDEERLKELMGIKG